MISALRYQPATRALLLSLAGCIVLVIGMGYGRFAFTGVLPVMLKENILTLRGGNLAASANYAGYLIGALLLSRAKPADARLLCILSVAATIVCLALLAWLSSAPFIIAVRGVAGACSAVTLISASLWLLQHLKHTSGAPILYAGVGLGIFISAEFISLGKTLSLSSQVIWIVCALSAGALFLLILRLLNSPPDSLIGYSQPVSVSTDVEEASRPAAIKLLFVYGLSGFGYIITATYLPLFLSGSLSGFDPVQVWAIFGLAAVPSCFIWHRLLIKYGYRKSLIANLLIQAIGVLLPAISHSVTFCLASALLVGFTFMGTVTIALPEGKRLAHVVSFNMISAMTAFYGIGQIAGPLIAGALYSATASFSPSLAAAAVALIIAAGLVAVRAERIL